MCEQQKRIYTSSWSVAEQAGLSLAWSQTPEDSFFRDVVHYSGAFNLITALCRYDVDFDGILL